MSLKSLALEHTMGLYFSSGPQVDGQIDWEAAYAELQKCAEEGVESPYLLLWSPFENWTYADVLERIDTDTDVLESLLVEVANNACNRNELD